MQRTDLEYSKLLQLIKKYLDKGRTESQAFLNWFLENIYRQRWLRLVGQRPPFLKWHLADC